MLKNNLVVLDASVIVKWFHEELDSTNAERIQEQIAQGELRAIVPPLLFYEIANVLTFKAGSVAEEIIAAHHILLNLPLQIVEVVHTLLEDAIRIAHRHRLSVYDAIYVALAIANDATLITADQELIRLIGAPTVQSLTSIIA